MYLQRFLLIAVVVFMIGSVMPLAAGEGDVYGQAGVVRIGDGGGTHALVGGGVSGMVGDKAAVFGEFNYVPLGDYGLSSSHVKVSSNALLVGGGVRAYIPTGRENVRLYVPVAGGLLRIAASASGFGLKMSDGVNGGYVGAGIGAEIGQKFGVRPEFRYNRYQISGGGSNVMSASVSVFYKFGK